MNNATTLVQVLLAELCPTAAVPEDCVAGLPAFWAALAPIMWEAALDSTAWCANCSQVSRNAQMTSVVQAFEVCFAGPGELRGVHAVRAQDAGGTSDARRHR